MEIVRTDSANNDFKQLVGLLDAELTIYDGDEHDFYDQFNKIDNIKHVIVVYLEDKAIACGAIKLIDNSTVEIKRMYVVEDSRGKGFASIVVAALEEWATELHFARIILETGKRQVPAVKLYRKLGFEQIENYEPYVGVENSICFQKLI